MMRSFLVLAVGCALLALAAEAAEYTNKYDGVDVDRILQNPRVLNNYIKCMLDQGACTPDGRELKKTLPDALVTGCSKCNEKQKNVADKVTTFLMRQKPQEWELLVKKYDPKGEFKKRFEAQGKKF